MTTYLEPGSLIARAQAAMLAKLLNSKGFETVVRQDGGHAVHPCIQITTPRWRLTKVTEFIYVAPTDKGDWWFWWSSLELISPAVEVDVAADKIARADLRP